MLANVTNIAANLYPNLSTCFFKVNINKILMKKKKSVKEGLALFAE